MKNHTDRAVVVELLYAISNVAHAEYHAVELLMLNRDADGLIKFVERLKVVRTTLMGELAVLRPSLLGTWCIIKHLSLAQFHLFETFEKTKNPKFLAECEKVYSIVDDILARGMDSLKNLKDCPRCDDEKQN